MSGQPENVEETTKRICEAGIAHRMLVGSFQDHLPDEPSGCKFWVEVKAMDDMEYPVVYVQTPNGQSQAFHAEKGKSFGVYGQPPLNYSQQAVVNRLAEEWKQNQLASQ